MKPKLYLIFFLSICFIFSYSQKNIPFIEGDFLFNNVIQNQKQDKDDKMFLIKNNLDTNVCFFIPVYCISKYSSNNVDSFDKIKFTHKIQLCEKIIALKTNYKAIGSIIYCNDSMLYKHFINPIYEYLSTIPCNIEDRIAEESILNNYKINPLIKRKKENLVFIINENKDELYYFSKY